MENYIQSNNRLDSGKKVFQELIKFFDEKKISYCVLGDTSSFPENITSDIDLFLEFKDKKSLFKLIKEFCLTNKLKIFNIFQHEINSFYFTIVYQNNLKKSQFLQLDLCNEYIVDNHRILKFDNLASRSLVKLGDIKFRILNPEFELTYYLLKKIYKLEINDQHFNHIYSQSDQIKDLHSSEITKYFSNNFSLEIVQALKKHNNQFFIKNMFNLKKDILNLKPIKLMDIKSIVERFFHRIFNPTGLFIVFLGCDGVGKSIVIKKISEIFKEGGFRRIKYFHFAPLAKYQNKNAIATSPHKKKVYSFLISFIKLIYLYFVYLFGYFFNIKPLLIRSSLIILDRFVYDIIVDPKRYRIKFPAFFIKLISYLLPKPDLVFILDATVEIIQQRKREVDSDILHNLKLKYLQLKNKIKNTYVIDNSQNLDQTLDSVFQIILKHKSLEKN